MNAVTLSKKYSIDELVDMQTSICCDPDYWTSGGFERYTKVARKKLSSIAWAITYRMQADKTKRDKDTDS